ncbi:MAG: RNA 3'-terminal phosphate cyclase [Sulfolobales archaeon]|nr:RNA 3'-terminal phosphate cyclase [Sulfolobales archaeon]MDW7968820.1 RNA 3'-terminal phosphate cyclase [Sulfolobales archaeon]
MDYVVIDGSLGEGGGQILRTSVALSSILMKPIKVINIRAKRRNPGLQNQHITAVKAAAEITNAAVEGLHLRSTEITFVPRRLRSGRFTFDIGTAGSATLVLQTVLPILLFIPGETEVEIIGGTDVPWSPPIDYFKNVILHYLRLLGAEVSMKLLRRGHYPVGGGVVITKVLNNPVKLRPIKILERGNVTRIRGVSHCVKLPKHVAERQAKAAEEVLKGSYPGIPVEIGLEYYDPSNDPHLGPGSGIVLWAETDNTAVIGADALGAKGKRAEEVGSEAARKLIAELNSKAALDTHMGDNIIPYLSIVDGESEVSGSSLTTHTSTVVEIVKMLTGAKVEIQGSLNQPFKASVIGVPRR